MSTKKPQLKSYINESAYKKFKKLAEIENRSISNLLEITVINTIKAYEAEHGEIILEETE